MISYLKKIFEMIRVYRHVRLMVEARSVLAAGHPDMAEKLFERGEIGLTKIPINLMILKGQIKFHIRKRAESYEAFSEALNLINSSDSISCNDKLYLKLYIYNYLSVYSQFFKWPVDSGDIDGNDIDLSKIRADLKSWFPLRSHPDWGTKDE